MTGNTLHNIYQGRPSASPISSLSVTSSGGTTIESATPSIMRPTRRWGHGSSGCDSGRRPLCEVALDLYSVLYVRTYNSALCIFPKLQNIGHADIMSLTASHHCLPGCSSSSWLGLAVLPSDEAGRVVALTIPLTRQDLVFLVRVVLCQVGSEVGPTSAFYI